MEKEILFCTVCSSQWERNKTRGRKPKLCPQCLESSNSFSEQTENGDSTSETNLSSYTYPPKTKWKCTSCGIKFQTLIPVSFLPAHKCQKRAGRFLSFELY